MTAGSKSQERGERPHGDLKGTPPEREPEEQTVVYPDGKKSTGFLREERLPEPRVTSIEVKRTGREGRNFWHKVEAKRP